MSASCLTLGRVMAGEGRGASSSPRSHLSPTHWALQGGGMPLSRASLVGILRQTHIWMN